MKITRSDSERLMIVDFPYVLGAVFVGAGLLMGWHAVDVAWKHPHRSSDVLWPGLIGLFFILGAGMFVNRCVFDFDLRLRELKWSRTGLFGRKRGTVPLGTITG